MREFEPPRTLLEVVLGHLHEPREDDRRAERRVHQAWPKGDVVSFPWMAVSARARSLFAELHARLVE
jgi:hypothetical protein